MSKTIQEILAEKTLAELSLPTKQQTSRVWTDPEGYKYLVQWSNCVLLRFFVRLFTESLPKSEYRRKAQLDDAARSVVRNIEEGYKRAKTKDYIDFIGYSQGSLEEVKGDIRELTEDKFMKSIPGSSLNSLGVDLGGLNQSLRNIKGNYRNIQEKNYHPLTSFNNPLISSNFPLNPPLPDFTYRPITLLYPPLKPITSKDLTYEIFMELINKTDFLLRKLVESLELKQKTDKDKFY